MGMYGAASLMEVLGVIFFATIFRTAVGFGEALVSVPLLALVIPVKVATPVAVFASILVAGFIVFRDWRHVHFRSAGWLISSTLVGLPLGLFCLKTVPEFILKSCLACLILIFSGYSLLRPRGLSLPDDRFAWVFGFCAGVFGGSCGMNGPPLAIYGALRGWSPERFRATLQGYFLPASLLGLCGFGVVGILTPEVGGLALRSLPAIVAGIFVGRRMNRRMNAVLFTRVVHVVLILVALVLLFQSRSQERSHHAGCQGCAAGAGPAVATEENGIG